jgi:hypothetical protein
VTAREISEARTRLLVVLLRDCELLELLRVKHRIDSRLILKKAVSTPWQALARHSPCVAAIIKEDF